jgi:hypothetical protein
LAAGGRTLLVDPGTYTYTGSSQWRDSFRTSAAHNTLTIDGQSSSAPDGPFSWKSIARSRSLCWSSHKRFNYFSGMHDGYGRLPMPATHERSIFFLSHDYWIVRDQVQTSGTHQYDLHFHFAADASPSIERQAGINAVRERNPNQPGLEIVTFCGDGAWRREEGWVSQCYGERSPGPILIYSASGAGNQEFVSFLVPRAAQSPSVEIRELEAEGGGRAFEIRDDAVRDLLLMGSAAPVAAARMVSDFEWTWARCAPGSDSPSEFVLLNGSYLALGGRDVFRTPRRASFVVIQCLGEKALIDTDADGELTVQPSGGSRILSGASVPSQDKRQAEIAGTV